MPSIRPALARRLAVGFSCLLLLGLLAAATVSAMAAPSPTPVPSASTSGSASGGGGTAGAGAAGAGALPGDPAKGQQLYNSAGCTACHGASLSGGVGPKLNPMTQLGNAPKADQAAFKAVNPDLVAYIIQTITNGRGPSDGFTAMPAKGGTNSLSDQDIKDLAAYIISLNQSGKTTLGPEELARSNVFWVTVGIIAMLLFTYLLARYNMRWIGRRAAARKGQE